MSRNLNSGVQGVVVLTVLLMAGLSMGHGAQEPTAPVVKAAPVSDIFSGTVMELTAEFVVVERRASMKDPVLRKFTLDGQTKVEGVLKVNARVTVRFQTDAEDPAPALHIIVR
jgi:hypothetical protein